MKKIILSILFIKVSIFSVDNNYSKDNAYFYQKLMSVAEKTIGLRKFPSINGTHYRGDCSGFICFLFHAAGLNLRKVYGNGKSGVVCIWNGMQENGFILKEKKLSPGDIVFFDNTYDKNRNNKWDDYLTHIALVYSVDQYGTITYLHYGSKGVVSAKMNLKYPDRFSGKKKGKSYRYNDILRRSRKKNIDPRCLSGALYRGAAHIVVKRKASR